MAIPAPHPMVAYALDRLGIACQLQDKNDEAEGLYLRSLALQQAGRWPPTPWTEVTLLNLAILYGRQGKRVLNEALLARLRRLWDDPAQGPGTGSSADHTRAQTGRRPA